MIAFRVDGNSHIGLGHVMRCLSIADAFLRAEKDSLFIVSDDNMHKLIEDRGYKTVILNSEYDKMEEDILSYIMKLQPEMLIIDSYYVTKEYLSSLRKVCFAVYIDDLASFAYPVDILVNYNIYSTLLDYEGLYAGSEIQPRFILGTENAPLREMFRNIPKTKIRESIRDVLITTGGADPIGLSLKLIKRMNLMKKMKGITYHFLIGSLNPDRKEIERLADNMDNVKTHHDVRDMKTLIQECDIVVSAAGSTMYEICACGIPLITYVLADNQKKGAEAFSKYGLALNCGDFRMIDNSEEIILENIKSLSNDYELRKKMSARMQKRVDGRGADRLVKQLLTEYSNI